MKKHLILILLITVLLSCNRNNSNKEQVKEQIKQTESESRTDKNIEVLGFNYKDFEIKRGQLGEIKIGMTISEAEKKISGLRKETDKATSFGYGGGSPAYLYYDNDKVVFGLIPALNKNTILFIIAASPKLTATNGLFPNSTTKEIAEKYTDIKVNQDLMNGWEYISDETNNWDFVFMTDKKTVGEYPELETPSELKNLDIKTDWITIK